MAVSDNCNASTDSCIDLGDSYTNDTGLAGDKVFTGSWTFQVKEIEVFEITK
jgi:fructose-specific component phosphotransferase system IIB-like protein